MSKPNQLFHKLAKIVGELSTIPKSGYNSFHKYDYVTENDLVNAVRSKLSEAGIFVFTSVDEQSTVTIIPATEDDPAKVVTTVKTSHTFADAETGETFTVHSQGQGEDKGDKGVYKAITGAMKYFLYKQFMFPTGDDPENDSGNSKSSNTNVRNRAKRSGRKSRSKRRKK